MRIDLSRVDEKTPFNVLVTDALQKNSPSFWLHPDAAFNPKTKAYAKGFVFTDKKIALNMTVRFILCQLQCWPEMQKEYSEHFKKILGEQNGRHETKHADDRSKKRIVASQNEKPPARTRKKAKKRSS